eukprot:TRINITY_DN802_c0_g1_i1.p1 TRINITY_DN802_c0_g1~~TRINITY_DN802_c0_g1_i1.p1  ORF type:complete len:98 (+),score=22.34 TRINITY_DN802_c0_g1_i1:93-386(+)
MGPKYLFLSTFGYTASYTRSYTVNEILPALELGLGFKPILECATTNNINALSEVWICVDKNTLATMDCDPTFFNFETKQKGICTGSFYIPPTPGGNY